MLQPQPAHLTDAPSLLRLRDAAASWMQRRQLVQWAPGEVTLGAFQRQVAAGEWHVLRSADDAVIAALRLRGGTT